MSAYTGNMNKDNKRILQSIDEPWFSLKFRKVSPSVKEYGSQSKGDLDSKKCSETEPVTPESETVSPIAPIKPVNSSQHSKPVADIEKSIEIDHMLNADEKLDPLAGLLPLFMSIERAETSIETISSSQALLFLDGNEDVINSYLMRLFKLHTKIVSRYTEFIAIALNINNTQEDLIRGKEYVTKGRLNERLINHCLKPLLEIIENYKNHMKINGINVSVINNDNIIEFIQSFIIDITHMLEEIPLKFHYDWELHIGDLNRLLMLLSVKDQEVYRLNSLHRYNIIAPVVAVNYSPNNGKESDIKNHMCNYYFNLSKVQHSSLARIVTLSKCLCIENTNVYQKSMAQLAIDKIISKLLNKQVNLKQSMGGTTILMKYFTLLSLFFGSTSSSQLSGMERSSLHYFWNEFANEYHLNYSSLRKPVNCKYRQKEINYSMFYFNNAPLFSLISIVETIIMNKKLNPFFCVYKSSDDFEIKSVSLSNWKILIEQMDDTLLHSNKLLFKKFLMLNVAISQPFILPWLLFYISVASEVANVTDRHVLLLWKDLLQNLLPWDDIVTYLNESIDMVNKHSINSKTLRALIKNIKSCSLYDLLYYMMYESNFQEISMCEGFIWFDSLASKIKQASITTNESLMKFKSYNASEDSLIYDDDDQVYTKMWTRALLIILLIKNVINDYPELIDVSIRGQSLTNSSCIKNSDSLTNDYLFDWGFELNNNNAVIIDDTLHGRNRIFKFSYIPDFQDFDKNGDITWGYSLISNYDYIYSNDFNSEEDGNFFQRYSRRLLSAHNDYSEDKSKKYLPKLENNYFMVDTLAWLKHSNKLKRFIAEEKVKVILSVSILNDLNELKNYSEHESVRSSASRVMIVINYLYAMNQINILKEFESPISKALKNIDGSQILNFNGKFKNDLLTKENGPGQQLNMIELRMDNVVVVSDDKLSLATFKKKGYNVVSTKVLFSVASLQDWLL
ncbi:hypothetical protein TPHA_0D04640 [Tetrapisispora phaffii CBS 4417]|uniref:Uncharacterized protein n=1 Tax=Tetrapisispora phaffii (strain ATCC 24235 / CBS 4417 / NBRC 1672 / NRRL Y-8282 / UCD 70-5) TaxID=1071381 RepID=G8BS23_TETPH|nr:hypothetical protein TPHA_0D04640 [Tetrapisispora phaffii CBS 4417]CCE63098.1 hypothetical protein TPHA_0D04640 [Tetrapisispora phaffii CBS 4417]